MSDAWANKADYDEDRAHDQLLREEYERIQRDGRPQLWDVAPAGTPIPMLDLTFAGLGDVRLTIEQARQLGSALLAEVEIATRGDI